MKNKRLLSLGLTGVLVVASCGCGNKEAAVTAVENSAEGTDLAEKIVQEAVQRSSDKNAEKEETVYVNADASGAVENITVSSWLKNGSAESELTDVTSLENVENVKGDETFTKDGDSYVWAANGSDIYYQGETSKSLPVDVKVTYYLDGQEIAPKDLAGKSGRVKIRFDYENRTAEETVIGGEETTVYVPFVAASTMILDSDKFVNVEAENGKVISDGKNTIVAGVAMPGLYDSLALNDLEGFEDVDIPEYVEVTADVTDFELDMTATVLMPDVFSELNTDDMDGFDDLKDDIEELNDATYDLIDGCIELDDGVQELKDNMPDLVDGANDLDDGAWELDDGAQELMDGADELNDGAKDIREGAKALDEGVGTLKAGTGLLYDRMPELTGGVNALAEGLAALQSPMMLGPDGKSGDAEHPYIKTSVGLLKDGVDALVSGMNGMRATLNGAIAANQEQMKIAESTVNAEKGKLEEAVKEAEELQNQLTELAKQLGLISSGSTGTPDTPEEEDEKQEAAAPGEAAPEEEEEPDPEESAAPEEEEEAVSEEAVVPEETEVMTEEPEPAEDTSEETSAFAEDYLESLESTDGMAPMSMRKMSAQEGGDSLTNPAEVIAAYQKIVQVQTALLQKMNEITELQNQLRDAATEYAGLMGADTALRQVAGQVSVSVDATKLSELTKGMAALETSIGQIYDGVALINSQMGTLTGGAAELSSGIGTLKAGADTLKDGTEKLYQGGVDLREGTKELYSGTKDLKDGTEELKDGTADLKDGVADLVDGVDELKDGTTELLDGVNEYNEDGIQKLYETVTVDLQNLLDRVDALSDLSESYQSFSGKRDDMEGSVKFIIETDPIELEED